MTVFLLKNRSDDSDLAREDPYEAEIEGVKFVPVMDYHNINLDDLKHTLSDEDHYDGIVVTSQRAVDAMKLVLEKIPDSVLEKPIYTVGPTTAKRLEALRFRSVEGAGSGNGTALATKMVSDLPNYTRLLFLAGEIHRRQLPDRLTDAGHSVTTKIVYKTTPNTDVGDYVRNNVQSGDWVVFFSPSHTNQVLDLLHNTNKNINIAAIGPTTQEFLVNAGFEVKATAPDPTAHGLKRAITSALQKSE